jgi:hypothetical protein
MLSVLIQPHPPPRLNGRSLHRREGVLQPVMEPVVAGVSQVCVSLTLWLAYVGSYFRHVSGSILGGILIVSWLAHGLRVRKLAEALDAIYR